jgi:hypothetical protein
MVDKKLYYGNKNGNWRMTIRRTKNMLINKLLIANPKSVNKRK